MSYIQPPISDTVPWYSGPPPEIGWWPASSGGMRNPKWIRYWNGKRWSVGDHMSNTAQEVSKDASVWESLDYKIEWTERWWLK